MNYSVKSLTTVADCDVLLSMAAKEKADLNFKQLSAARLTSHRTPWLQNFQAHRPKSQQLAPSSVSPESQSKEGALDRKTRLEYKKFLLEMRVESYGTTAWLKKNGLKQDYQGTGRG